MLSARVVAGIICRAGTESIIQYRDRKSANGNDGSVVVMRSFRARESFDTRNVEEAWKGDELEVGKE